MPDPLRIAMVAACPFPAPRGTPIRIRQLAEALARRGHDVHVVAYHLGEPIAHPSFTLHRMREVRRYERSRPGPSLLKLAVVDPLLALRLRQILRAQRFDVIHAHHAEGLLVALLARGLQRTPLVYDVHTILEAELPFYPLGFGQHLGARVGRAFDRRLPALAAHVVAAHEDIRKKLCALDPSLAHRLTVANSGVDVELLELPDASDGRATLVYTGNLAEYQGIEPMLHAFAKLRVEHPDARLRIVSDMSFAPYEPLAARLGIRDGLDIVACDFAQVARHLAEAAVALHPRISCDGMPQKLLNYMAAGKAIVAFRGAAKQVVDEQSGLVVENGDVIAFAFAIARLLNDRALASRLGANARAEARASFSWDRAAVDLETVYRALPRNERAV